ncbi:unnamed protein product [Durusdinium trenchii]|uniref:Ubiquitin-like domain-containing protein n=1 Tax=Durusdinium trenchii TaxID=1381693 RepID=A0ABP0HWZ1_9DINO
MALIIRHISGEEVAQLDDEELERLVLKHGNKVRSLKDYCKSLFGTSVYKQRLLKNGEILSDNHALTDLSSAEILGPEEEWILVPACFWLILQSLQVKYQSQLQTRTSLCLVCLCMPCIFCSWCVVRLAELTFPLAVFPRIDVLKEWFQSVAV